MQRFKSSLRTERFPSAHALMYGGFRDSIEWRQPTAGGPRVPKDARFDSTNRVPKHSHIMRVSVRARL
jgi:hypothetical protein